MAQRMGMKKKTTTTFIKITIIHTPIPMTPFGIRIYSFSWIASSICAQCMRSWRLRSSMQCSSCVCVCVLILAFLFWPDSLLLYGWYRIGSECSLLSWCMRVVSLCHMHWHHDIIQHLGCRCNSQHSTLWMHSNGIAHKYVKNVSRHFLTHINFLDFLFLIFRSFFNPHLYRK